MNEPPKKLIKQFNTMFDAMWHFNHGCRDCGVPPDRALAMILSTFFSMLKTDLMWRRDLMVRSVNQAMEAMDREWKE